MTDKTRHPAASVTINGDLKDDFDTIRGHMKKILPRVDFSNAEVIKQALWIAADYIRSRDNASDDEENIQQ